MITSAIWPALDYSRVPYRLYHDAELYRREQERIFRGPVWNFLGLDAEIPNPGDFRATYVGETPVIFNRDRSGTVKAFVNRCAHRGALVRREISGNAEQHICIYHQWCYGLDGGLTAIPFRRGIRGKAGSTRASTWARTVCGDSRSVASTEACSAPSRRRPTRSKITWARQYWRSYAACSSGRSGCSATIASGSEGTGSFMP